jgi:hypothetical protein
MRRLLLALFASTLGPVAAQDGGKADDEGIEVSEDPKEGEKPKAGDDQGDDEEKTRKKNVGLAGGGEGQDDDANAPKVKADLQARINEAIEAGVKWLKEKQDKDGSWGPVRADTDYNDRSVRGDFVRDELGPTAWAVYTLAKCGVKKSDPSIQKGLKWIEKNTEFVFDVMGGNPQERDKATHEQRNIGRANPRVLTTYESAAIVLMIEAVYESSAKLTGKHSRRRLYSDNPMSPPDGGKIPEDVWRKMHDRIVALTVGRKGGGGGARGGRSVSTTIAGTQNLQGGGKNQGGWRYGQASGDADLSATQFVLLALRAASQAGYPVEKTSPRTWDLAAQYVRNCQKGDGGFGYQVGGPSYASMTACGVGSLLICKEQMQLSKERKPPDWIDGAIERGMEWLDKSFEADRNEGHVERPELFYYLYGVERVGDLTGRKEFNGKDWYVRGAIFLLERQDEDGKWVDATGFRPHDVLGTCFALLFLKRATPPVVTYSGDDHGK